MARRSLRPIQSTFSTEWFSPLTGLCRPTFTRPMQTTLSPAAATESTEARLREALEPTLLSHYQTPLDSAPPLYKQPRGPAKQKRAASKPHPSMAELPRLAEDATVLSDQL